MRDLVKYFNNYIIKPYGWFGIIRLFIYPITHLFINPVRLFQSLLNCKVLIDGKWHDYLHFSPRNGINSLFYWTIALNLLKFGRNGTSHLLGLGKQKMSQFFYLGFLSTYTYYAAPTILLLVSFLIWTLSYFLFVPTTPILWASLSLFLAIISTTYYSNLFLRQNYNMLGWAFLPLCLFFAVFNLNILLGFTIIIISLSSITVLFVAVFFIIYFAFTTNIAFLYVLIPAAIIIATRFYPFFSDIKNLKKQSLNILKLIGFTPNTHVKYIRKKIFLPYFVPSFLLYGQFLMICLFFNVHFSDLFIIAFVLFFLNSTLFRFADWQSIQMLTLTISTFILFFNPFNYILLISFWLMNSPLPLLTGFVLSNKVFDIVPIRKPFHVKAVLDKVEEFLAPVKAGQRVLTIFPKTETYEQIFDDYRIIHEIPLHIAAKNNFHLMPDWYAVADTNYKGAPPIFADTPEEINELITIWKPDFILFYQEGKNEPDTKWKQLGFDFINKLYWGNLSDDLWNEKLYFKEHPTMYLSSVSLKNQ